MDPESDCICSGCVSYDRSSIELLYCVIPIKFDIREREKARTLNEGTNELDLTTDKQKI